VTVINQSYYPLQTSMSLINKMQDQFSTLQTQLATGLKANTLAQLGNDRYFDLSIRSRMSRLDGYSDSINMVNTRLSMFDQVTSRLAQLQTDAGSAISPSAYGTDSLAFGTVPNLAQNNLDEVVNLLNTDVDGRYLFAGSKSDKPPVATMDAMLNGAAGKAGFKQVASERQQADVGDGLGRLQLTSATNTVTLAEDGAQPFGFKLSTASSTSGAVTLTQPAGTPPQTLQVQFTGLPTAGDTVSIGLTLPDGTSDQVTLKAVTGTPGAGEFQIGTDAQTTATNFKNALQSSLQAEAGTTLVGASNNAAADNFFNGQGQPVQRVQGPNFATATQLVTADPSNTVLWYTGSDDADARASVTAKIDDAATVQYGAQADENGTVNLVRGLAVLAIQNFSAADPTSAGRFDAIASRNSDRTSASHNSEPGSIAMMTVELDNAKTTTSNISSRHTDYSAQLTGMLSDLESIPQEDVATQILALQTRLQASYQATSLIAHLSLVNYLPT
jgi:flagellar hook-associated protein 3 FlgL